MIPNRGHLIAFSEKEAITEKIVEMLDMVKANKEERLSAMHHGDKQEVNPVQ